MSIRFFTAGESHGPTLTAIIDGLPAGILVDIEKINLELKRRQTGFGSGGRMKIEKDTVEVLSGIMDGKTTGAPITLSVKNDDHIKWKNVSIKALTTPRPGHADLTGVVKFGFNDLRPTLERSSARETTMRVAAGALFKQYLEVFGIFVGGYVRSIGNIENANDALNLMDRYKTAESNDVRCFDSAAEQKVKDLITATMQSKDTLGGVLELFATGLPIGLGSYTQWDKRLDAKIAFAMMSVQAMKGVEIGDAWENSRNPGTEVHDGIFLDGDHMVRRSNRAGGIEGGISNGEPIIVRVAMKPIATTLNPQHTVDITGWKESPTTYERSDFCPVPRAVPILEAMLAYVLANELSEKLGGDSVDEMLPRFNALAKANQSDLNLDGQDHIFWS
jgi:chorismate synthase